MVEWINCSTMKYDSAIKRIKQQILATTWMNLKIIILSETSQTKTQTNKKHSTCQMIPRKQDDFQKIEINIW